MCLSSLMGREKTFDMHAKYKERREASYALEKFPTEVFSHRTIAPAFTREE